MSLNKSTIIGNIGRDAELRYTPNGNAVADVSVAVTEKRGQNSEPVTTWFKVTLWGKFAEAMAPHMTKGKQVYVEGPVRLEQYTDRDGNQRSALAITASEIKLLGGNRSANAAPAANAAPNAAPASPAPAADDTEDIPF